ncbi:poly-beta-hydroxybutyrate-responsive repressor [Bacillus massiliigorillae]|uniref:poly-beta-hydroxybutyrate-responsive repressor n=1 Tax=Bacillus massiliigorillae TaxID=1243664 RepID=UPI0003A27A09|nr:poly-beta-hydroxybutyrate-responsive repressor [Bacillus massiliigorillae]
MVSKKESGKEKDKKDQIPGAPKNFIVPVLLLLLKDWNAHGYELMQKLTQFGLHSIDQGNLYRILRQLEKDELVTSEWDTSSKGPAKRIYSITSVGEQYLDFWATSLEQYQKMLNQFFYMYNPFFISNNTTSSKDPQED